MTEKLIATEQLANGLVLSFYNQGNRYFGDYHQVKVVVSCPIAMTDALLSDFFSPEDLTQARQLFGDHVEYRRLLKQMGVAGAEVERVETALIDHFRENAMSYMQGDDFAGRFVARRLAEHRSRSRGYLPIHRS